MVIAGTIGQMHLRKKLITILGVFRNVKMHAVELPLKLAHDKVKGKFCNSRLPVKNETKLPKSPGDEDDCSCCE
jgi:hypothetical protein